MSLFSLPLMLNAQSVDEMLQKVSAAVSGASAAISDEEDGLEENA